MEKIKLNEELLQICLGYYNFDKFTILLSLNKTPEMLEITSSHEAMHHHLNVSSSYGLLINRIKSDINQNKAREKNIELLDFLTSKCVTTHEMLATYWSLVGTNNEDLLVDFPKYYQECYQKMKIIVEPLFNNKFMRLKLTLAVARTAMMNNLYELCNKSNDFSIKFIKSSLLKDEYPDKRIEKIATELKSVDDKKFMSCMKDWCPGEYLDPCVEFESESDLDKYFNYDKNSILSFHRNLELAIFEALFALLSSSLPDLEENYSNYRTLRLISHSNKVILRKNDSKTGIDISLYSALEKCDQKIKFFDEIAFNTQMLKNDPKIFAESMENSINKLGILYTYFKPKNDPLSYQILLNDVKRDFNKTTIKFYSMNKKEHKQIEEMKVLKLNISEIEDIAKMVKDNNGVPTVVSNLTSPNSFNLFFVHVNDNPINFMERVLEQNHSIEWTSFKMGYSSTLLDPDKGVEIVLYWINNEVSPIYFHLSNHVMTSGIFEYTNDFIRNSDKVCFLKSDSSFSKMNTIIISRFIDHPVFNFYLKGELPKIT